MVVVVVAVRLLARFPPLWHSVVPSVGYCSPPFLGFVWVRVVVGCVGVGFVVVCPAAPVFLPLRPWCLVSSGLRHRRSSRPPRRPSPLLACVSAWVG